MLSSLKLGFVCIGIVSISLLDFMQAKPAYSQSVAQQCNYWYQRARQEARSGQVYLHSSAMMNIYCVQVLSQNRYYLHSNEIILDAKDYACETASGMIMRSALCTDALVFRQHLDRVRLEIQFEELR